MANRHLSRSIVLQTLYEWDFNDGITPLPLSTILAENTTEFAPENNDNEYMDSLVGGILRMKPQLDEVIAKAAPDWPIEKIAVVDRNVLRIGLYELLYGEEQGVPPKVAINEAIELAKQYGGESSGRFINGVLGSVYRQLGEPGKEQQSKKNVIKDIPLDQMPIEKLGGALIYTLTEDEVKMGLVFDVFGRWTIVKEDLQQNERVDQAIMRALVTKLGIRSAMIGDVVSESEYVANDPETGKTRKQVAYHLVEVPFDTYSIQEAKGLQEFRWFTADELAPLNFYDDMVPVIAKAIGMVARIALKRSGGTSE